MANKNDQVIRGRYQSSAPTPADGDAVEFQFDADGNLKVVLSAGVTISAGDIEIGAVELKDGTTDTRAVIGANGIEVDVKALPELPAGANNIGSVDVDSMPVADRLTDNMGVALQTDVIMNDAVALTPKFAPIAASSSGDNTVVAAVTDKKIRVLAFRLSCNGAVNAKFQSDTTDLTGLLYMDAAGKGEVGPFCPVGLFETASGIALQLNLSGAVAVGGYVVYVEV